MKNAGRSLLHAIAMLIAANDCLGVVSASGTTASGKGHGLFHDRYASTRPAWKEGEVIVRFKAGADLQARKALHQTLHAVELDAVPSLNLHRVKLAEGMSVVAGMELYKSNPAVAYAEPNYIVTAQVTSPNDPLFSEQWSLNNIGQTGGTVDADIDAPEAWNTTTGTSNVVIAVIDTGIDYSHPDLLANLWTNPGETPGNDHDEDHNGYSDDIHGINAITETGDPWDDHGHGTHVAGTIAAVGNNGAGITGVSWNVKVVSCKFLNAYGFGYDFDAIKCLEYVKQLKDEGVNIVATSNSWGGGGYSQALLDAIDAQRDILFIAAAGNYATNSDFSPFYPSSYDLPNVVPVAATDSTDSLASFSNYGSGSVFLGAPGAAILSTLPLVNFWNIPGRYGSLSGTSMAAPHVSGVASLLKAANGARDWRAIRNLLLTGSDTTPALGSRVLGGKRLNANDSLNCTGRPLLAFLRPPSSLQVGSAVTLRALSVNCGSPSGPVTVTLSGNENVTLRDDGIGPDVVSGDGVFSATWTPTRDPEKIALSSPAGATSLRIPAPYIGHYLPEANTRASYSQFLSSVGARPPLSWSLVGGVLPPGLSFNGANGEISGLPTTTGVFPITVRLDDSWGQLTRTLHLRVGSGLVRESFARQLHEGIGSDARDVKVDPDGNIYLLGNLGQRAGWIGDHWVGMGKNYLAKYSAAGSLLWLKRYETGFLRAIALDGAGAVYAA